MVAFTGASLTAEGTYLVPTTLELCLPVLPHREFSSAHLSPLGQKGAEPGPQETTHHHVKKQETAGRA